MLRYLMKTQARIACPLAKPPSSLSGAERFHVRELHTILSGDNHFMETENKINTEDSAATADQHDKQNATEGREQSLHLTRKFMQVGWLLNRYHQQKRGEVGPMGDPFRGQGRILALLKLQPDISQSELAYLLGMRPQSAGELLGKLERQGLVERTQSESDKRVLNVRLTPEGEKAAEKRDKGKGPFAMLTHEEKATLDALLEKVANGLEEQVGAPHEEGGERRWGGPGPGRGWKGEGGPGVRGERGRGPRGPRGPLGRGGGRPGDEPGPQVEMYIDLRSGKRFGGRRGFWGKRGLE